MDWLLTESRIKGWLDALKHMTAEIDGLTDAGMRCPAFVSGRTIKNEPDNGIHTVNLTGTDDSHTQILMIVDTDGGLVVYDDGETALLNPRIFRVLTLLSPVQCCKPQL